MGSGNELYWIIAGGALVISLMSLLMKTFDKNLSIREHEAYREAVARDIARVEIRLQHLEQTRPTTGELEILAEALNKRMDEIKRSQQH